MTMKFTNVNIEVLSTNKTATPEYYQIINDISGEFSSNSLTAIMGPSGCGKSSFMLSLAGRIPLGSKTSGTILVEGKERDYRLYARDFCIIEQDEDVFQDLTIYDTLSFTIDFYNIKPLIDRKTFIDEILERCGLTEHKNDRMKSLSRANRKRALLVNELIKDAEIIFADEPTAGLDNLTAFNIMQLLKAEAEKGKTVIVCVHQLSMELFELFDNVMLINDAEVMYHGPTFGFENYLLDENITDNYSDRFSDFIDNNFTQQKLLTKRNVNYNYVEQTIEYNPGQIKQTQNDMIHDYRINIRHISLIYARKWKLALQKKFAILKFFAIYTASSVILYLMCKEMFQTKLEGSEFSDISRYLENNKKSESELLMQKECEYLVNRNKTALYLSSYIGIIIFTSIDAFFYSTDIVKREIAAGAYSSTSYVLGTYLYYVVRTILFMTPSTIIFLILYASKVTLSVIVVHFIAPILLIPLQFATGSITEKRLFTFVTTITSIPFLLIPPQFISKITIPIVYYEIKEIRFLVFLYYAPCFIAPSMYFSAFYMLILEKMFSWIDKIAEVDNAKVYIFRYIESEGNDNLSQPCSFLYLSKFSIVSFYIGMMIIAVLFVLYKQSHFLMPAISMKL